MKQIILLNSYVGLSGFTFDVMCSGRRLDREEVLVKGLVTKDQIRRNVASNYTQEWYEVVPGDSIIVEHFYNDEPRVNRKRIFRIPQSGMQSPNTSLDNFEATGIELEEHLLEQCELVGEESVR